MKQPKVPRGLAIERQAREVETVLDAIRALTHSASRKYQNEVWARTLSFLLNSADLLLADPLSPEEMGMRVGSRVVDTLFDLWFHAVLNEEIPSPTYWRTLAALCRRWRHHHRIGERKAKSAVTLSLLGARVVAKKKHNGNDAGGWTSIFSSLTGMPPSVMWKTDIFQIT
ncbi:hypothetical protein ANCDUO_05113 [Ancylostoma duodenale]|uniref:Ral GTPase-activating protein subunit alpha/beta N-terminal domain-containing protein n=1 Tax=Ancylostoma duodenale TaxID=51022 RepID=A0A0C2GTG6_9BILA|nr:hypothetical protein ANCDUO_05113 [Ancylostoma duodenale]